MTLIFYDNPASTNAHEVRLLLAELERQPTVRLMTLHHPSEEYEKLHPFGLVPTLIDDELVITESNVALRYLAEAAGRDDLRGRTPAERARVDLCLDSLSLEVRPSAWQLERLVLNGESSDDASVAQARAGLSAALSAYDRLLDETGPYARGTFTIADCAIAGRLHHLPRLGLDCDCAPRLRRALAATQSRPAWQAAIGSLAPSSMGT